MKDGDKECASRRKDESWSKRETQGAKIGARGRTPTPRSQCVKAVDKGLTADLYGKAINKGLSGGKFETRAGRTGRKGLRGGAWLFTGHGSTGNWACTVPNLKPVLIEWAQVFWTEVEGESGRCACALCAHADAERAALRNRKSPNL